MRSLELIAAALIGLLRFFSVDVWKLLFGILAWLSRSWWRLLEQAPSEWDRQKKTRYSDCIPMSHPAFKIPDPLIYSQEYLMRLGLAVTWDNPDIVLTKGGVDVSSHELEPDTEYEIVGRIWNGSNEAPVVDLPVSFSYLAFGIGTQSFPITDPQKPVLITLGVKGSQHHPAFAVTKWRTPPTPGHYCIQVRLDPVSDANYGNNFGQENTQVVASESPAEFTFLLRNNTGRQATMRVQPDTYVLPDRPVCGKGGKPAFDPKTHAPGAYPVPAGWLVDISPSNVPMQPEEERLIAVRIDPPAGFKGRKAFNLNAFADWSFVGGLTAYIDVR